MVYTLLSVDDFSGMKITSNMKALDYLLAVSEVSYLKSMFGEEDNLLAEQDKEFRIKKEERITQNIRSILSSFPHVLDPQKSVLDFVVPRRKRSMPNAHPRKVTERFGGELMIKKAVEINSEKNEAEHILVKIDNGGKNRPIDDWSVLAAKLVRQIGVSVSVENRVKTADNRENRGISIHYRGSVTIAALPVNGKRSANDYFSKEKSKARMQKKRKITARAPVVIINRELSTELKHQIISNGGSVESAKLVIEKTLFETDVKPAEGRFSIPQNKMSNKFLKPDEEELLNMRNEANKMCEMNVMLIEPSYQICEINLRKWTMNKDNGNASSSYVLVKHWNGVVRRNCLTSGMTMQLWAFRKDENLCFALINV